MTKIMIMPQNLLVLLFLVLISVSSLTHASNDDQRKSYIVYMGELSQSQSIMSLGNEHHNLLLSAIGDETLAKESKIYSYGRSFNGFAARLLPHEVAKLMDDEKVVSVFESTTRKLHTTRSWSFLGMPGADPNSPKRNPSIESDIIIATLDTGIYMDAPSFNDTGFGPPPAKWKGSCQKSVNFTGCNNKVIGARSFKLDPNDPIDVEDTPLDEDGHGSHTSSIAAGVLVKDASLYGIGAGTARGGVPFSRIAAYKVCWNVGCSDIDVLAGFDQAIADGVDVISVSIGGASRPFFVDVIAIGSFHAMKKGILTCTSSGNSGAYASGVENVSPWLLTVGATSIDRQFLTAVRLGNGMNVYGMSINTYTPKRKIYPLISGAQASNKTAGSYGNASACDYTTIGDKVKGKIVFCLGSANQDYTIQKLGGVGTILSSAIETDLAFTTLIPGSIVNLKDGNFIGNYINSTRKPRAVIYRTSAAGRPAPFMASFSARGPQIITPDIFKPDISAPGLNILAAYSKLNSITGYSADKRFTVFNIMSGTSMACPHAAAAAAYVKSFHPDWSPNAIKSALMTTALPIRYKEPEDELAAGAGQINPIAAVHPGLVYDIRMSSYIRFLCKEGYNSTTIGILLGGKKRYNCSSFKPALGTDGLNYPSIHVNLGTSKLGFSAVFYRTVTNVGYGKSVYTANVKAPRGVSVEVIPRILKFESVHERRTFKVVVNGGAAQIGTPGLLSGWLEWTDSNHIVRSPILVFRKIVIL